MTTDWHSDPTAAGLLRAVLEAPGDDTPRLVLADRLDDLGEAARAEFIRVQCRLAAPEYQPALDLPASIAKVYDEWRQNDLLTDVNAGKWAGRPLNLYTNSPPSQWPIFYPWTFRRGFVDSVTCYYDDWASLSDLIRACHPVTKVTLTTWPSFEYHATRTEGRLSNRPHAKWWPVPSVTPPDYAEEIGHLHGMLAAEWPEITFTLPPSSPTELPIQYAVYRRYRRR